MLNDTKMHFQLLDTFMSKYTRKIYSYSWEEQPDTYFIIASHPILK